MKKVQLLSDSFDCVTDLTMDELLAVEGGSFWKDAAFLFGATVKCIWVFAKTASEFQASLPPNLKK